MAALNPSLNFSYNWNNKLTNKAFTTVRLWNPAKYKPGNEISVKKVNKQGKTITDYGRAKVVDVKKIMLSQINDYIAYLDTGYDAEKMKEILQIMYKNKAVNWQTQPLAFVLLAKVETKPTALTLEI